MRWLLFACGATLFLGCGSGPPPAGSRDTGPRVDMAMPDGGAGDTGTPGDDAGDAAMDDAGSGSMDAGDASMDAGGTPVDLGTAPTDMGTATDMGTDVGTPNDVGTLPGDTGATIMPDGAHPCVSAHLTGTPLGSAYDWQGCVLFETQGTGASIWGYNVGVADHGVAFFHASGMPTGSGQPVSGTFLLPPTSVPAPYAAVCAGTGSTIDVDGTGAPTAFSFLGATALHTTGSSATGGLVITLGSPTTLAGDLGTHHFASTADAVDSTTSGAVTSMVISIGTSAISLVFEQSGSTIVGGIAQVASGSTTDVYTLTSGTATSGSITLPSSVSFLGTCGAGAGTQTLVGTISR